MSKAKILFIEDDLDENPEDNETWFGLIEHGYEVIPARNGQNAWNLLASNKFDLVLIDIMLPLNESSSHVGASLAKIKRMDMGLHILSELRSGTFEPQGTPATVPVVVVSAVPGVERWKKLFELAGNERFCLTKPCSPLEVIEVLEEALSQKG